jgi:hypothetical protein
MVRRRDDEVTGGVELVAARGQELEQRWRGDSDDECPAEEGPT